MRHNNRLYEYMPRQVLNRHWLWVFLWTVAGILLARSSGTAGFWLGLFSCAAGLVVLWFPIAVPRRSHIGIALLCCALGAMLYTLRQPNADSDSLHQYALTYPRQRLIFEGYAGNTQVYHESRDYLNFEMRVTHVRSGDELLPVSGKALVRWNRANMPVFNNTQVRVTGRLSPHVSIVNHEVRSLEAFYHARGVFSVIHANGDVVAELKPARAHPGYWASRLRQWQSARLARIIPESAQPFINGVWLGDRTQIDRDAYNLFIRAGTAHVLAVSGVHVAIIAFSLNFLLGMSRLPRRLQIAMMLFGVLVFMLMTGARVATVRATLMIMLYFSAELLDRESDALSTLGLCGFAFLVWNPNSLFEPAFQMSFGSVAAILLFYPGATALLSRVHRIVAASIATTLVVQVFTWPLAAWHFHLVPIAGILANVLVVPLLTVTLWLCFITAIAAVVAPPAALLTGHALLPIVTLIQWTNNVAATLPLAYTTALRPSVLALFLYGLATLYFYRALYDEKLRRRNLVVMSLLLVATALFWRPAPAGAHLDFLDVGHGDAIFARTPGGTTLLVDGGDASEYANMAERAVAPFLYANGVTRLDYVAISHNHRDHIGGLFHIIEQFPVGTVLLGPERETPHPLEQEFLELCMLRGVPVLRLAPGDIVPAKDAILQAVHPAPEWAVGQSENNRSLTLYLAWQGFSALLAGDVEIEAETRIAETIAGPVTVLKAPHHGSATSSAETFLRRMNPNLAVASVRTAGARAPFMPDEIMERYADLGITLYRTDWHGGVRITTRNGKISVATARGVQGYTLEPRALANAPN